MMRLRLRLGILRTLGKCAAVCGLLAAGMFLAGCRTPTAQSSDSPGGATAAPTASQSGAGAGATPGAVDTNAPAPGTNQWQPGPEVLRPGDIVKIIFLDAGNLLPIETVIKEDGSIPLPLEKSVQAAGKTTGELETAIRNIYVPKYYIRMTVTVQAMSYRYSIKGEVRNPNAYAYPGAAMTVLKAVASAGDFTDFARKRKVRVTRSNGKIETEDCIKAMRDPKADLPVYPGDLIIVPRKGMPWQK